MVEFRGLVKGKKAAVKRVVLLACPAEMNQCECRRFQSECSATHTGGGVVVGGRGRGGGVSFTHSIRGDLNLVYCLNHRHTLVLSIVWWIFLIFTH